MFSPRARKKGTQELVDELEAKTIEEEEGETVRTIKQRLRLVLMEDFSCPSLRRRKYMEENDWGWGRWGGV